MLVKAAVGVVLVHNIHLASVPTVNIIGEEHVNVVAVNTHCATNVAVSVVHLAFPLLAVSISALTHAALRLLNGDVKRSNLHMSLLIVAGFLLCLGGVGVHFGRGCFNLGRQRLLIAVNIVGYFVEVAKLLAVNLIIGSGIILALVRSVNLDNFLAINEHTMLVDFSIFAWLRPLVFCIGDALAQFILGFLRQCVGIGFVTLNWFFTGYDWLLRLCIAPSNNRSLFACLVSSSWLCGFCSPFAFCNGCVV